MHLVLSDWCMYVVSLCFDGGFFWRRRVAAIRLDWSELLVRVLLEGLLDDNLHSALNLR